MKDDAGQRTTWGSFFLALTLLAFIILIVHSVADLQGYVIQLEQRVQQLERRAPNDCDTYFVGGVPAHCLSV